MESTRRSLFGGKIVIESVSPIVENSATEETYELWKGQPGRQVTVYIRPRGCHFGNHVHRGTDPSKNPERLFIAHGAITATLLANDSRNAHTVHLKTGDVITIFPGILHRFIATTDTVIVEYRRTIFSRTTSDTYPVESPEGKQ